MLTLLLVLKMGKRELQRLSLSVELLYVATMPAGPSGSSIGLVVTTTLAETTGFLVG